MRRTAVAVLLFFAFCHAEDSSQHFTKGRLGMVASGSKYATAAGVRILEQGGNAMDAAAAAAFAIMVTDPANTSMGGRTQILLWLQDGQIIGIDGATQAPAAMPRSKENSETRQGYQVAPVPGAPAALDQMVRRYGRKPLAEILQPAIELADSGFAVPSRLARTWSTLQPTLRKNPGTAVNFLKSDGSAYAAGELFRQPRLAALLRRIAAGGCRVMYSGEIAQMIARDVSSHGGWLGTSDLANYAVEPGRLARTRYREYEIVTAGARTWGSTLHEMLNILSRFPIGPGNPSAEEIEIIARAVAQSLADRPRDGSGPQSGFGSPEFYDSRAAFIREHLSSALVVSSPHDTTHLSVMDAEGNAVALTTSIGFSFGSHVATPELGFIYAHSYRMESGGLPRERDMTEMSPTIVFDRRDKPILVVGGAGSERIPSAVLQVISNVLDRHMTIEQAVRAPRVFLTAERLRIHRGFPTEVTETLARHFLIENVELGATLHLGLVHAVAFDSKTREFSGAADLGDSGAALGPLKRSGSQP